MTPDSPGNLRSEQAYKSEILTRWADNASRGIDCDTKSLFADTLEAGRIGLTEDPNFKDSVHLAGDDPIVREAFYLRLKESVERADLAPTPQTKESEIKNVQQDLHLASLFNMDQEPKSENYKPFYEYVTQIKDKYGPKSPADAFQTDKKISEQNQKSTLQYLLLEGDEFVKSDPQTSQKLYSAGYSSQIEQAEAVNNGVSVIVIPEKYQDAVGVMIREDGIVNMAVADGVSHSWYSTIGARMAIRGSLDHLSENASSLNTFRSAHMAINEANLETSARKMLSENYELAKTDPRRYEYVIKAMERQLERGTLGHTTLATAQYNPEDSKLNIGVKGDSSVLVFRENGPIERFYNPRNPQIYYDKSRADYPEGGEIIQTVDINPTDVIILCSDGLKQESFEKINQFLVQARSEGRVNRLDKQVKKLIMDEPQDFINDDDVSVVIFSPTKSAPK